MASYKDYKSISAAQKAGSIYYTNKAGKKMLAVTKEQLDDWKERNEGKYKGSALTAWANAKGKDLGRSGPGKPEGPVKGGGVMTLDEKLEVDRANADNKAAREKLLGRTDSVTAITNKALKLAEAAEEKKKKPKPKKKNGKPMAFAGKNKGGLTDFRKTGMFYGGLANRKGK